MDFDAILALGRKLGVDPEVLLTRLTRRQVERRMRGGLAEVVRQMEEDGVTPRALSAGTAEKRQLIRTALFKLWRVVFSMRGGGHVADFVRDTQDDPVVAWVSKDIRPELTTQALVELVMTEALERAF